MSKQHTTPCRECPWRRKSAPGWLGASTPLEFVQQSESGMKMPCHLTIDYEQPDWQSQIAVAPHCAGHAVHMANRCKSGRPLQGKVDANRADVFAMPQEFVDHHSHGKGPQIMIAGSRVIVMSGAAA